MRYLKCLTILLCMKKIVLKADGMPVHLRVAATAHFPKSPSCTNTLKPFIMTIPSNVSSVYKMFVYKKSLDSHLNQQHQQKEKDKFKYRCSECYKATDNLTEFKVHMNRHHDIKPYKCNICNQKCFYLQS